jgi:hypothetical protein
MNGVEQQLARLARAAQGFAGCIRALPEERFLQKMEGWAWAPRDVLAHLVGWLRLTVEGSQQVRQGQLPSYFADPGEDWSHVNALLVRRYASPDREVLLAELEAALADLARFLRALDPGDWDRDFGVRYKGYAITIQNSVEALVEDFTDHRRQIVEWAGGLPGGPQGAPM